MSNATDKEKDRIRRATRLLNFTIAVIGKLDDMVCSRSHTTCRVGGALLPFRRATSRSQCCKCAISRAVEPVSAPRMKGIEYTQVRIRATVLVLL